MPRELTGSAVSHRILKANCLQRDLSKCVAMNMASFLMGNSWRLLLTYYFDVASCPVHRCKFHKKQRKLSSYNYSSHKRETIFLSHSHTQLKPSSYPILTLKGNHLPIPSSHSRETIFKSHPHTQGKPSSYPILTLKGNQGKPFSHSVLTLRGDYLPILSLQRCRDDYPPWIPSRRDDSLPTGNGLYIIGERLRISLTGAFRVASMKAISGHFDSVFASARTE